MNRNQVNIIEEKPIKIAYLMNQYPKVSHSFIRREILALETLNFEVVRVTVRSCANELVDEIDFEELAKTHTILNIYWVLILAQVLKIIFLRPLGFLTACFLAWKLGKKGERGIIFHFAYLAEACVLFNLSKKYGVEHVHAHFGTNSTTVALLCHTLGGPPYSFTVHGPEEFDKNKTISLQEKIRSALFVVAISSFGKSQIYRWSAFGDWSKVHVVHCGVDEAFLTNPFIPINDSNNFICVARLSEQKGHLLLLEAVRQLLDEGYNLSVTLVGDGELRPQIERLICKYHLQDSISLVGWASSAEVKTYVSESRALVLPSFAEGLPVVIMEAFALGRPVISSCIAGIPELVETGVNGWLVVPGSVDSLVAAMRSALLCPTEELDKMGRLAMERVRKHHNIDLEARALAKLFRQHIA